MRRIIKYAFWLSLLTAITASAAVGYIGARAQSRIFRPGANPPELPHPAQVALIPGASVLPNKKPSNTLLGRLRAGIELYKKQIVPKLLLSGDNTRRFYDEVHSMRDYCLQHGVKGEDIFLDHAGIRTYDTMARAHGTFAVKTAIIVSQELYLPRAVYLAESLGLKVEGYVAESSSYDHTAPAQAREYFARVKSIIDIVLLRPQIAQDPKMPVSGDGRASWNKK